MKSPPSGDLLDLLDGDLVAELLKAGDEATFQGVPVAAVEVVAAEVAEGGAVLEEVVGVDEDRVGDGDGGPLLPASGGEAMVLGAEVGVPSAAGPGSSFDQGRPQP